MIRTGAVFVTVSTPNWFTDARVVYRGGYLFVPAKDLGAFANLIIGQSYDEQTATHTPACTRAVQWVAADAQATGVPGQIAHSVLFDVSRSNQFPEVAAELRADWVRVTDQRGNLFGCDRVVFSAVRTHTVEPDDMEDEGLGQVHAELGVKRDVAQWTENEDRRQAAYLSGPDVIDTPEWTVTSKWVDAIKL